MSPSLTRCIKYNSSAVANFVCRERSGLQGGILIPAKFITQMPHGAKLKGGLASPAGWPQRLMEAALWGLALLGLPLLTLCEAEGQQHPE